MEPQSLSTVASCRTEKSQGNPKWGSLINHGLRRHREEWQAPFRGRRTQELRRRWEKGKSEGASTGSWKGQPSPA